MDRSSSEDEIRQLEAEAGRSEAAAKLAEQRRTQSRQILQDRISEANRAEAQARTTTEKQDYARRAAEGRAASADADAQPPESRTGPNKILLAGKGFSFSENELMRRFGAGSLKTLGPPSLRNEMENAEVRTHVYGVGKRNTLYTMEYKDNQRVRDFAILLSADSHDDAAIGLILFGAALDVVTPGLTSFERSSILDPMIARVSQDGIYERDMKTYVLKCLQMARVFYSFTPK